MSQTINIMKEPIHLHYQQCGKNDWYYKGTNPYVACCPYCRTSVSIRKHRVRQEPQNKEVVGSQAVQALAGTNQPDTPPRTTTTCNGSDIADYNR